MEGNMKVRVGIGVAVAVVAVLLVLSGMNRGQKKAVGAGQKTSPTTVKARNPVKGDIKLTTGLTGTVEPSDFVYVYAKASGDATGILVKSGDMVEQGQVLCKTNTEQMEISKNSADTTFASLSETQNNLSRIQILYNSGDLSDQGYKQYSNQVKSARPRYESAKLTYERQVEYSTVIVSISGEAESCDIEVHDRMPQSTRLRIIAGEEEERISFYVTERMMGNMTSGGALDIQKNGVTYQANISEVSSMADSDAGLFKVRIELKDMGGIAADSTVKLSLVVEYVENAMTISVNAVCYSSEDGHIYLYEDDIAQMVQVEVGLYDSKKAEILSDISEDDMVVSTWSPSLYEGARIQLREESGQTQDSSADRIE